MRRIILATVLVAFLAAVATASAHTVYLSHGEMAQRGDRTICTKLYTVAEYKKWAKRFYLRPLGKKPGERSSTYNWRMHVCQHSFAARKAVGEIHDTYLAIRRANKLYAKMVKDCSPKNVLACIRLASQKYNVSYSWLVSCARSESGLDPYVTNHGGSGASGLFQFMPSTFYATLSRMGVSAKPLFDPYWQSMAAAFKFHHDGSGEWTGPGC